MTSEAVCSKCGGTGFIITEHSNLSGAAPCDCRAQGRAARLEDRSQIPVLYRKSSFDNFVVPGNENPTARRELTTVLLAVKQFVRDFPNEKRPGLLLIGETGCGKTHLAVAALREIIAKGFEGLFCNYQTLLNDIKAGYDAASNSSNREAYQTALDAEVLLVDDLGAHRTTDWVEDTVNSIVTYRCDNRPPRTCRIRMPAASPFNGQGSISRNTAARWPSRSAPVPVRGCSRCAP
jgi:DNA replication protein DnaC